MMCRCHHRWSSPSPSHGRAVSSSAAALFYVTDAWGPLSGGSRLSATGEYRIAHLITYFILFCKFYIWSLGDPKFVVQILLRSWWSVVFRKNMILAFLVEFLEDLNWNLKFCFWMYVNLFILYLEFLCSKNYEIFVVICSWHVWALIKVWGSVHV